MAKTLRTPQAIMLAEWNKIKETSAWTDYLAKSNEKIINSINAANDIRGTKTVLNQDGSSEMQEFDIRVARQQGYIKGMTDMRNFHNRLIEKLKKEQGTG